MRSVIPTPLGEAGFTLCEYVLRGGWTGAEGTLWIFTKPLMRISWCWKDMLVALIINFSCLASIAHRSFWQYFLLFTLSHHVHCPWLSRETALAHLAASSWRHISFTTISLHSGEVAFLQPGRLGVSPRPQCKARPVSSLLDMPHNVSESKS